MGDAFAPPLPEIFMSSQSQPFIAGYENAGHETAGQKNKNAAFRYFFKYATVYDALCVNDCLLRVW